MKRDTVHVLVVVAALLGLGGLAGWSVNAMLSQKSEAAYARDEVEACRAIAAQIEALSKAPKLASAEIVKSQRITEQINDAARAAGIDPADALDTVRPEDARPVGDTDYQRKPTRFSLRGVTLQQTALLLHRLTDDTTLTVSDLRLRTPHSEAASDRWNVEATVSYLIYAPEGD